MRIKTLAVWSALEATLRDGAPRRLYRHQGRTLDLLNNPNVDVVVNKAMTGDGKSLAAQLQTLLHSSPLLAMYPTNELIRDQQKQVERTMADWQKRLRVERIYGDRLDELVHVAREHGTKAEAIKRLADNNDVILTNPDIFHYICQFYYTRKDDTPDLLFGRVLVEDFDLYVFDEFHIFQIPQIVSILNALLLIRDVAGTQRKKFLFLSATPQGQLEDYLSTAGFRVASINGEYTHANTLLDSNGWRRILCASDIMFHAEKIEEWVDMHLEDTLMAFFKNYQPCAKGALIVNSVAVAYRLAARLKPRFAVEGLTAELNTGLTGEETKRVSYEADLLIGTSTVDVGVDFRINFLVFESRDSGTFLQRLGRLGRHKDDGHGHTFEAFEAHALVPKFVAERLFIGRDKEQPVLADGAECTREELRDAILKAYPEPTDFRSYAREWGGLQSASVYYKLGSPTVRDAYAHTRERLREQYRTTFGINVLGQMSRLKSMREENKTKLAEEAQSFRGASPFACGVIDQSEQGRQRIKENDLFRLAPNFEIEWLSFEEFKDEARRTLEGYLPPRFEEFIAHFRLHSTTSERRRMTVRLNDDVGLWSADQFGVASVIKHAELDMVGVPWLNEVNNRLRRRELVALLCLCPPDDLRYRLRLPPLFELYEFVARDGIKGTIAFARNALLLHVAVKEKHFECGGSAMIV